MGVTPGATPTPREVWLELGRYRLEEQVGQGGMAVVWRAFDTQLRRVVAVKVLHPHLHAREEIRRRFDREAHAVALLHHPFILDLYDISGPGSQPSYLVTEFIRGQTLRAFAEAHPFDPPELAALCLLPIAQALGHAHAAGVVHRDLKPENVMVREDGVVKLTDFGIAALLEPDEKFTVTGSILGSPAHLAPETIEGKPADPRADLFSFGTILYWLSCGKLPYEAASPAALLHSILAGKRLDPRMIRPSVSDAQAKVIARCMENDPQRRYQSAAEVERDLLALLRDAGLADPVAELAAFVRAPDEHARDLRARLVARSLAAGEESLAQGKTVPALAAFGRALALEPQNELARGRVERIRRRERIFKVLRRMALAALGLVLILLVGWQARASWARQRTGAAVAAPPTPTPAPGVRAPGADKPALPVVVVRRTEQPGPATKVRPAEPPRRKPLQVAQQDAAPRASPDSLPVKLHARFSAKVTVDGQGVGNQNLFELRLPPGPHKVLVQHPCCADALQELVISPNKDVYQLDYGAPRPAEFKVINGAPDGARLLIDGVVNGTASEPRPYSMSQPDQQVTVTIGDRTLVKRIKAGMVNPLDYAQAAP